MSSNGTILSCMNCGVKPDTDPPRRLVEVAGGIDTALCCLSLSPNFLYSFLSSSIDCELAFVCGWGWDMATWLGCKNEGVVVVHGLV